MREALNKFLFKPFLEGAVSSAIGFIAGSILGLGINALLNHREVDLSPMISSAGGIGFIMSFMFGGIANVYNNIAGLYAQDFTQWIANVFKNTSSQTWSSTAASAIPVFEAVSNQARNVNGLLQEIGNLITMLADIDGYSNDLWEFANDLAIGIGTAILSGELNRIGVMGGDSFVKRMLTSNVSIIGLKISGPLVYNGLVSGILTFSGMVVDND
jgi:hypothetical protein